MWIQRFNSRLILYLKGEDRRIKVRTDYSTLDAMTLPPAPTFDSETGVRISNEKQKIHPESPEHFIYLMQRLRIGNSECLTFSDSRANAHLIDRNLAKNENLQRISETQSALGVFRGGSIISEFGNFRFNLGSEKDAVSLK